MNDPFKAPPNQYSRNPATTHAGGAGQPSNQDSHNYSAQSRGGPSLPPPRRSYQTGPPGPQSGMTGASGHSSNYPPSGPHSGSGGVGGQSAVNQPAGFGAPQAYPPPQQSFSSAPSTSSTGHQRQSSYLEGQYRSAVPTDQYDQYSREYRGSSYQPSEDAQGHQLASQMDKMSLKSGGYSHAQPMPTPSSAPSGQYNYQQQQQQQQPPRQTQGQYDNYSATPQQQPQQQQQQSLVPPHVEPCHPNYIAMTCNYIPATDQLRRESRVPMGLVLHPLADPPVDLGPLPSVNFGKTQVIRCKQCRTYINPYVSFADGGRRWRCNLCTRFNEVPSSYFSPLNSEGVREDLHERLELCHSSIEVIAPPEYTVRAPQPPVFVFVVDVSQAAVESGMLQIFASTVLDTLDHLPGEDRAKRAMVAFITFNSSVHFYNLNSQLQSQSPQMIVCPDIDDIFLPQPEELLVYLSESRDIVDALLEGLPEMHRDTTDVECALGPAILAAKEVMKKIGGKMLIFSCGLASIGVGQLKNRESQLQGTPKEGELLKRANDFYKTAATKHLTYHQISADVFQFSDQYCDVATVSGLARGSGGSTYFYDKFSVEEHGDRFSNDLLRNLTRNCGWEAVMRVRVGTGLSVQQYFGSFNIRGRDLLALPAIDCDKAFTLNLKHDDKGLPQGTRSVSVQAALLYTTSFGERRIRIHTHIVPVVSQLSSLFPEIYVSAMCNLLAKRSIEELKGGNLREGRELIQSTCLGILQAYRKSGQSYHPLSCFDDYPENLNTLPSMTLGLLKHEILRDGQVRDGTYVRTDIRATVHANVLTMGVQDFELFMRPRMINLNEVLNGSIGQIDENGDCDLPPEMPPASSNLTSDSVCLVDNGQQIILRIGRNVDSAVLQEMFGVSSLDECNLADLRLQEIEEEKHSHDSIRTRVNNVISFLRGQVPVYQNIQVVVEGDVKEQRFKYLLIEDRTSTVMSYDEFIEFIDRNTGYGMPS